jgi:hypothetical protein
VDVWYAEWELAPGDSLRRMIDDGIERATHFIVMLTPASLASEWVQVELDAAMVNRIAGKCRLIPVLHGIRSNDVPTTLRGMVWVSLESYDEGRRQLISVCHDVSRRPPLGEVPGWASERPLPDAGISTSAQRLAAALNRRSEKGWHYDMIGRDDLLTELGVSPDQLGMAASELEEYGWVKLHKTMGCGPAGFSTLQPRPRLFIDTDPALQGWNPAADAVTLAAAMLNNAGSRGYANIPEVDEQLKWGPRRLNPAAEYLDERGYIRALRTHGGAPYTFTTAAVDFKTRRFADSH